MSKVYCSLGDILSYFLYKYRTKQLDKEPPFSISDHILNIKVKLELTDIKEFKQYLIRTKRSAKNRKILEDMFGKDVFLVKELLEETDLESEKDVEEVI